MKMKEKFSKFLNWFENLFFTNHSCVSCLKEIKDGTKFQICESCFKKIEFLNGNLCEKCGDKVLEENKLCDHCKNSGPGGSGHGGQFYRRLFRPGQQAYDQGR